jgi:hypothetical protein
VKATVRIALLVLPLALGCAQEERYVRTVDVAPNHVPEFVDASGEPPWDAILGSLTSEGPVHALSFYGDFDPYVARHGRELIRFLQEPDAHIRRSTYCSMFHFAAADTTDLVGRNYDNVATDLLLGWFYPPDGYRSITLFPLSELGFDADHPFDPANRAHRNLLLNAPQLSVEGMNEAGVTITLASLGRSEVEQIEGRQPRFLLHLVREILDHAGSVHEAVDIASRYNLFDNGRTIISHHVFLAGPDEGSVVLEWHDGRMQIVSDGPDLQVVTNSDLADTPEGTRRQACSRYRRIAKGLDGADSLDWRGGLDLLAGAAQHGRIYRIDDRTLRVSTQWSAIFDLERREVRLCMHGDYGTVYRMRLEPTDRPG